MEKVKGYLKGRDKINLPEAIKYRLVNRLSFPEIGRIFNCTGGAVHHRLKAFSDLLNDPEKISVFTAHKQDILSAGQLKILTRLLDDKTLKGGSVNNLAYAFRQLADVELREKGKPDLTVRHELSPALQGVIDKIMTRHKPNDPDPMPYVNAAVLDPDDPAFPDPQPCPTPPTPPIVHALKEPLLLPAPVKRALFEPKVKMATARRSSCDNATLEKSKKRLISDRLLEKGFREKGKPRGRHVSNNATLWMKSTCGCMVRVKRVSR
jgi:hypothetical protein